MRGKDCKLLLVGDPAQLPPVHLDLKPCLRCRVPELCFNKEVIECTLEEVVRQKIDSGIWPMPPIYAVFWMKTARY